MCKHANHISMNSIMPYFFIVFLGGLIAPVFSVSIIVLLSEFDLPHDIPHLYRPGVLLACVSLTNIIPGWLLGTRLKLPRRFDARYMPFILVPLLYIPLSWSILRTLNEATLLATGLAGVWTMITCALFLTGFLVGIRRRESTCLRLRGLRNLLIVTGAASLLCLAPIYPVVRNTIFDQREDVRQYIDMWDYFPFAEDNHLARPDCPPSLRIASDYPRLNGVYYHLPLFGAVVQAVYAIDNSDCFEYDLEDGSYKRPASLGPHVRDVAVFSTERLAFEALLRGESDIYFGPSLSGAQQEELRAKDLPPVQTLIAHDALVFFVHTDNPVQGLSAEQIRRIYAGDVDNWSALDGGRGPILAFQHPNSDIQAVVKNKVMCGLPLKTPLYEEYFDKGFVRRVADYRNRADSLGYDFYWNAKRCFPAGEIRFLAIDGIAPTQENVSNGSYPFSLPLVMVNCRPLSPESSALRDWIVGLEGQKLIAKSGYAPLPPKPDAMTGHP